MRCLKCGTPFCRRCHLGGAAAGLCTQCYHLFVVRDGVSGPARNQKLLEVQKEDERRERVFRVLSLLLAGRRPRLRAAHAARPRCSCSPGAAVLVAGRCWPGGCCPFTEASGRCRRPGAGPGRPAAAGASTWPPTAPVPTSTWSMPVRRGRRRGAAERPEAARMALEGTIKDFGLPDIFQLIGLQRKTGLLTLKNEKEHVTVAFENGMVVMADSARQAAGGPAGQRAGQAGQAVARSSWTRRCRRRRPPCSGWGTS